MQWFFTALILVSAVLSAIGGYGSTYVTRKAGEKSQAAAKEDAARDKIELQQRLEGDKADLRAELAKLRQSLDQNTSIVFSALNINRDVWQSVKIQSVPSAVADYVMLLFRTDQGRVTGKVRIKGSKIETPFSTTANKEIPVTVPNVWDPTKGHYADPTIIEFTVTDKTEPAGSLSILTKGWVDTLGKEPHL